MVPKDLDVRRGILWPVRGMADGGWRMADGGWRMEDGGWRMEMEGVGF